MYRRHSSVRPLPFLALAASLGGCVAASDADLAGAVAQPIDNGIDETAAVAESEGIVQLLTPVGGLRREACTGVMLDNSWVLTAQHCFPARHPILAKYDSRDDGSHDDGLVLTVNPDVFTGRVYMGTQWSRVAYVVYKGSEDVALVRLKTPMTVHGLASGYSRKMITDATKYVVPSLATCRGYGENNGDRKVGVLRSGVLAMTEATPTYLTMARRTATSPALAPGDSGGSCFAADGSILGTLSSGPGSNDDYGWLVPSAHYAAWVDATMHRFDVPLYRINDQGTAAASATLWRAATGAPTSVQSSLLADAVPANSFPMAYDDFDGDGVSDFSWSDMTTGQVTAWLMNDTTVRSHLTIQPPPGSGWGPTSADVDGDGDADIVWRNRTASDVSITFLERGAVAGQSPTIGVGDGNWDIAATADFDGDGAIDLLWFNPVRALAGIWYMNGAQRAISPLHALPAGAQYPVVGDFDGDGHADIVWTNTANDLLTVWLTTPYGRNGSDFVGATQTITPPGSDRHWLVEASADVNTDGKADLLWMHAAPGQVPSPVGYSLMNGATAGPVQVFGALDANTVIMGYAQRGY